MSRIGWLLIALLSLLLVVGWFFLIYQPTSDEIEDVRAETELVQTQIAEERAEAQRLREVRQAAPEAEASLSAGQRVLPDEPSVPSLFRQLQQASDEAGARLVSINPSNPSVVQVGEQEVASLGVTMTVQGSYFQVVDLARRIEDPTITSRALRWDAASLGVTDFPELTVTLSGQVFSRGVDALPSLEEPEEPLDEEAGTEDDEADDIDELDEEAP